MTSVALTILAFVAGWLGARWVLMNAKRLKLIDAPGHRSSHVMPTPTGGGLGMAMGAAALMIWLGLARSEPLMYMVAGLALALAIAGWFDDRKSLSPGVRLLMQAGAVLVLFALLNPLPPLALTGETTLTGYWLVLIGVLVSLWWINLFNFMDGIDGLAATQAVFMLAAAGFLSWWVQPAVAHHAIWIAMLITASAALGFLVLNWPPARVFMGDTGSLFLGFVMVFFALQTVSSGWLSYPFWMILGAVFIVDASVTLGVRLARGERPHDAHRSHVYQRLARRWGAHRPVTLLYTGINLLWVFPLAACAMVWPALGWIFVLLAYLPLLAGAFWLGAGKPERA